MLLSAKQAKEIDVKAREVLGISTLVLMETAGRHVADQAIKMARPGKRVAIFCGRGNNGADAFVAARHLLARSIKNDIFLAGKITDIKDEAKINLDALLKLNQKITEVGPENISRVRKNISRYGLIIDGLLGVGVSGSVRGIIKDLIDAINSSTARVLAIDIPSGLDATTGSALGCCVMADRTVTFMAMKRGMARGMGPDACGRIIVKDLGVPLDLLKIARAIP